MRGWVDDKTRDKHDSMTGKAMAWWWSQFASSAHLKHCLKSCRYWVGSWVVTLILNPWPFHKLLFYDNLSPSRGYSFYMLLTDGFYPSRIANGGGNGVNIFPHRHLHSSRLFLNNFKKNIYTGYVCVRARACGGVRVFIFHTLFFLMFFDVVYLGQNGLLWISHKLCSKMFHVWN